MNFKNSLIRALGGEVKKTTNGVSGNDFLRFGARKDYLPNDWKEVKMSDEDVYRGYPYAVIQKRANKVASLARDNLNTWAKPEVVDLWQKNGQDPTHPYLKIIEDSTDYSFKQFWKTICIYLDLAGAYYLGVIRNGRYSKDPKYPNIFSDVSKFVLLNPYEIKRVLNSDGELAGYIERKKDGRYREWPKYMIIPMRELNPFDSDKVWSMTDAAKEATYTLSQSGNYTRETLNGNLNAPGILTTDVILEDNQFEDFITRVRNHQKGEPVFGNGAGAITWTSMQQDLDRAALLDINEINRTTLFAVSGTSKTSLGIEQSGTTRETARVQTEQFISDTAQPRLEDIIDFLNLDYKKYYQPEYKTTGYWIEIKSAASRDYATETQATSMRQAQSDLAFNLMQKGYTMQSSYDYAEGKIELSDLELEKGLDKPQNPEPETPEGPEPIEGEEPAEENASETNVEAPTTDNVVEDDKVIVSEENKALRTLEGLEPHAGLQTNGGKGSGNFGHAGREGERGGSAPSGSIPLSQRKRIEFEDDIVVVLKDGEEVYKGAEDYEPMNREAWKWDDESKSYKLEDKRFEKICLANSLKANSIEEEHDHTDCDCGKVEVLINELGESDGKTLEASYKKFLNDIKEVQKETYRACIRKLTVNAFEEDDIISPKKKQELTSKLRLIIQNYWWLLTPLLANSLMNERNEEYGENVRFVFTNELQNKVENNAIRVSDGHMKTILDDVLEASNKAYTNIMEEKAGELIIQAYKDKTPKIIEYFDTQPTMTEALKAIRNTDILEENRKIYERANNLALEGYKREDIIKKIREEYDHLSKSRAELIARNETARAYGHSQYEADYQFLNSIGQLDTAYKQWYSRRPESEKDKICAFCQQLIDMGPIPFTQNFVSLGETLTAERDGKIYNFVCNYEDIESSVLHVGCMCSYHLILNGKTLNEINPTGPDNNMDSPHTPSNSNGVSGLDKEVNGGKGSGNFGHAGRKGEVGGSASKGTTSFNYDEMLATESIRRQQEIATELSFKVLQDIENKHPELIDRERQDEILRKDYEEYKRWSDREDRVHNLSYEEYKKKILDREIDSDGRRREGLFAPVYELPLYGGGTSPFLEGLTMYANGANVYLNDREGYDKKHGLSETIDKNKDLWTDYDKPLYRGISTNKAGLEQLQKGATVSMKGLSSWSSEKSIADRFTESGLIRTGDIPVVFVDKTKTHDRTMFYPFSSASNYATQYEYVQSGSKQYKVTDIRKEGDVYYADVESY